MNKYQKKKSRCIKAFIRNVKANRNVIISYKEAKRGFKYYSLIHDAKILPAHCGYNPSIYIIDETPIETENAMWTKDNPFVTRYMGKFHYKNEEETTNAD